jgi:hypothetical protein
MRKIFLILVLVGGCTLPLSLGYNRAEAAYQREVEVQASIAPNMPIRFVSTGTEVDGRGLSTLRYAVTNNDSTQIKKLQIAVFVVNAKGHFVGAEGWREKLDLKARTSKEITTILRNRVVLGDRVFVFVERVYQPEGVWVIDPSKLLQIVKTSLETNSMELPTSKFISRQPHMLDFDDYMIMGGDYCDGKLMQARDTCGSGGVQSFNCDPGSGAWGFSCR